MREKDNTSISLTINMAATHNDYCTTNFKIVDHFQLTVVVAIESTGLSLIFKDFTSVANSAKHWLKLSLSN